MLVSELYDTFTIIQLIAETTLKFIKKTADIRSFVIGSLKRKILENLV